MESVIESLFEIEGVDWNKACVNMPEDDLLIEILTTFYNASEKEITGLNECFDRGVKGEDPEALELYKIKVHAMKHSTALFGAEELSEEAKQLEYAARDGRKEYILANHDPFVRKYCDLAGQIGEALGADSDSKVGIMDNGTLLQKLELLEEAMDSFDTIALNDISFELENAEFEGEGLKEKMDSLQEAVLNFDSEAFKEAVRKIRGVLHQ